MDKKVFAKKYGYETFKDTLLNTLDFTLDQLEFTDEEKEVEAVKLNKIVADFEQKVTDKFLGKFTEDEMHKIEKYLTQETPDYMMKFTQIHTELNEEFGDKILESLEEDEE